MNQEIAFYGQSQGLQLIQAVVEDYGPLFRVEDARGVALEQDIPPDRVPQLLSHLARSGWIARLKRGLYVIQSSLLSEQIHPFAIATTLIEPSAISHWSALYHHGMTNQIPPMVQISTPTKVVTPEMRQGRAYRPRGRAAWRVLDIEVEFIQIQKRHFYGFSHEWVSSWHRVAITDRERTLLDLVIHPEVFGGIRFALETLETQLQDLDLSRLVDYTIRYDKGSVIKRTGWMLDTLNAPEDLLQSLQNYPVENDYPLDTQSPNTGPRAARWRIINNL